MYEKNIEVLQDAVKSRSVIRHVSRHRNPDGSMDVEGNLTLWNQGMEPFEKMQLWEKGMTPGYDASVTLQPEPYLVFIPAPVWSEVKSTILIAHGGGFLTRTGCEGVNAAWYFHQKGYPTAILCYRLQPYSRLDAMADMQRAVRMIRAHKEELEVDNRVFVMGFSAGAMLCANCGTHFDEGRPEHEDVVEHYPDRPDAVVMGYGAFSKVMIPRMFLEEPEYGIWGRTLAEKIYLAPEKNLSVETPPFFIWQTLSDDGRHGLNLARELSDMEIHYELHIFDEGLHGIAMADGENDLSMDLPHVQHWGELCDEWLRQKLS